MSEEDVVLTDIEKLMIELETLRDIRKATVDFLLWRGWMRFEGTYAI